MPRVRWLALVGATLLVLVAGLYGSGALQVRAAEQVVTLAEDGGAASIVTSREATTSFTAPEPGRRAVVARSDGQQTSRALGLGLLAVALLLAASRGRRPALRQLLALSIRSRTEWWRPVPGGRAPPRILLLQSP